MTGTIERGADIRRLFVVTKILHIAQSTFIIWILENLRTVSSRMKIDTLTLNNFVRYQEDSWPIHLINL